MKEKRAKSIETRKQLKREIKLAIDFSKQHLSVSKALQRHEYITFKEMRSKKNSLLVRAHKSEETIQKELINKYIEKRNILRMSQVADERKWIDAKLTENSQSAKKESRTRVEKLKSIREGSTIKSALKPTSATTILFYDFTP